MEINTKNVALKRLKQEYDEFKKKKLSNQIPINIQAEPQQDKGLNYYKWDVQIQGRKDTMWENYKVQGLLEFTETYPFEPPTFTFLNNFQHIHVYQDGKICLNIISPDFWDFQTSISSILIKIEELIHKEPNLQSPANTELCEIYYKNKEEYQKFIRENYNGQKQMQYNN